MDKILIPTLRFPPAGGVGLRRIMKIAKYLAQQGVEVHFITTKNSYQANNYEEDIQHPNIFVSRLPSLSLNNYLNSVPTNLLTKILRKIVYYLTSPLFFIDYATLWGLILIPYCILYMHKHNIRYMYVSGPPFSTVWHAAIIKKYFTRKLTLMAEWRDIWVEDRARLYLWPKFFFRYLHREMEATVLRNCDIAITVTDDIATMLRNKIPCENKVRKIENGYDPEDFGIDLKAETIKSVYDIQKIIYAGNIVGTREEGFIIFLRALKKLRDRDIAVVFEFMGVMSYKIEQEISTKYGDLINNGTIVLHPVGSPTDAIALIQLGDYGLVIVQRDHPEALTSKFFEYSAAGKTMICVGPDGELKEKIEKYGLGLFVTLDEETAADKIADYIARCIKVDRESFDIIRAQNSFAGIADAIRHLGAGHTNS